MLSQSGTVSEPKNEAMRVLVCGADNVGKTALIRVFCGKSVDAQSPTRRASDESVGCYTVPFLNATLHISEQCDTGHKTLATEVENYQIFLVCFAVNDRASYEYARDLRTKIERVKEVYGDKYAIVMVGTKGDVKGDESTETLI